MTKFFYRFILLRSYTNILLYNIDFSEYDSSFYLHNAGPYSPVCNNLKKASIIYLDILYNLLDVYSLTQTTLQN